MASPWKHPKTGIYWLRRAVPLDIRAVVGKREEKVSLKTRDPAEAKRAFVAEMAKIENRWARLREPERTLTAYKWCFDQGGPPDISWDVHLGAHLWIDDPLLRIFARTNIELGVRSERRNSWRRPA